MATYKIPDEKNVNNIPNDADVLLFKTGNETSYGNLNLTGKGQSEIAIGTYGDDLTKSAVLSNLTTGTGTKSITISSGAKLYISGGTVTNSADATLTVKGTLEMEGAYKNDMNKTSGMSKDPSHLIVEYGGAVITRSTTLNRGLCTITINNGGSFQSLSSVTNYYYVDVSGTFETGGTFSNLGSGDYSLLSVNNHGTVSLAALTNAKTNGSDMAATIIVQEGGTLTVDGLVTNQSVRVDKDFSEVHPLYDYGYYGGITVSGILTGKGTFTNSGTLTIDSNGTLCVGGSLNSQNKYTATATLTSANRVFSNTGIVESHGSIYADTVTNSGSFTVEGKSSPVTFEAASFSNSSSVSVAGFTNSTISISGTVSNSGKSANSGGMTVLNSTAEVKGKFTNSGALGITNSTVTVGTSENTSEILYNSGSGNIAFASKGANSSLTVYGELKNSGTLTVTTESDGGTASITVNGKFTNSNTSASPAVLTVDAGSSFSANSFVNNNGKFTFVYQDAGTNISIGSFNNSGGTLTIDVTDYLDHYTEKPVAAISGITFTSLSGTIELSDTKERTELLSKISYTLNANNELLLGAPPIFVNAKWTDTDQIPTSVTYNNRTYYLKGDNVNALAFGKAQDAINAASSGATIVFFSTGGGSDIGDFKFYPQGLVTIDKNLIFESNNKNKAVKFDSLKIVSGCTAEFRTGLYSLEDVLDNEGGTLKIVNKTRFNADLVKNANGTITLDKTSRLVAASIDAGVVEVRAGFVYNDLKWIERPYAAKIGDHATIKLVYPYVEGVSPSDEQEGVVYETRTIEGKQYNVVVETITPGDQVYAKVVNGQYICYGTTAHHDGGALPTGTGWDSFYAATEYGGLQLIDDAFDLNPDSGDTYSTAAIYVNSSGAFRTATLTSDELAEDSKTLTVSGTNLAAGNYSCSVTVGDNVLHGKFVVDVGGTGTVAFMDDLAADSYTITLADPKYKATAETIDENVTLSLAATGLAAGNDYRYSITTSNGVVLSGDCAVVGENGAVTITNGALVSGTSYTVVLTKGATFTANSQKLEDEDHRVTVSAESGGNPIVYDSFMGAMNSIYINGHTIGTPESGMIVRLQEGAYTEGDFSMVLGETTQCFVGFGANYNVIVEPDRWWDGKQWHYDNVSMVLGGTFGGITDRSNLMTFYKIKDLTIDDLVVGSNSTSGKEEISVVNFVDIENLTVNYRLKPMNAATIRILNSNVTSKRHFSVPGGTLIIENSHVKLVGQTEHGALSTENNAGGSGTVILRNSVFELQNSSAQSLIVNLKVNCEFTISGTCTVNGIFENLDEAKGSDTYIAFRDAILDENTNIQAGTKIGAALRFEGYNVLDGTTVEQNGDKDMTIEVGSTLDMSGGASITVGGDVEVSNCGSISLDNSSISAGSFTNEGSLTLSDGAEISLVDGVFINKENGVLTAELQSDGSLGITTMDGTPVHIENTGTIYIDLSKTDIPEDPYIVLEGLSGSGEVFVIGGGGEYKTDAPPGSTEPVPHIYLFAPSTETLYVNGEWRNQAVYKKGKNVGSYTYFGYNAFDNNPDDDPDTNRDLTFAADTSKVIYYGGNSYAGLDLSAAEDAPNQLTLTTVGSMSTATLTATFTVGAGDARTVSIVVKNANGKVVEKQNYSVAASKSSTTFEGVVFYSSSLSSASSSSYTVSIVDSGTTTPLDTWAVATLAVDRDTANLASLTTGEDQTVTLSGATMSLTAVSNAGTLKVETGESAKLVIPVAPSVSRRDVKVVVTIGSNEEHHTVQAAAGADSVTVESKSFAPGQEYSVSLTDTKQYSAVKDTLTGDITLSVDVVSGNARTINVVARNADGVKYTFTNVSVGAGATKVELDPSPALDNTSGSISDNFSVSVDANGILTLTVTGEVEAQKVDAYIQKTVGDTVYRFDYTFNVAAHAQGDDPDTYTVSTRLSSDGYYYVEASEPEITAVAKVNGISGAQVKAGNVTNDGTLVVASQDTASGEPRKSAKLVLDVDKNDNASRWIEVVTGGHTYSLFVAKGASKAELDSENFTVGKEYSDVTIKDAYSTSITAEAGEGDTRTLTLEGLSSSDNVIRPDGPIVRTLKATVRDGAVVVDTYTITTIDSNGKAVISDSRLTAGKEYTVEVSDVKTVVATAETLAVFDSTGTVVNNDTITVTDATFNAGTLANNDTITITNSQLTVGTTSGDVFTGGAITNSGAIMMDANSLITAKSIDNSNGTPDDTSDDGTITIDATSFDPATTDMKKVIDLEDGEGGTFTGTISIENPVSLDIGILVDKNKNDYWVVAANQSTLYVNSAWATDENGLAHKTGDLVGDKLYYGYNAFSTFTDAYAETLQARFYTLDGVPQTIGTIEVYDTAEAIETDARDFRNKTTLTDLRIAKSTTTATAVIPFTNAEGSVLTLIPANNTSGDPENDKTITIDSGVTLQLNGTGSVHLGGDADVDTNGKVVVRGGIKADEGTIVVYEKTEVAGGTLQSKRVTVNASDKLKVSGKSTLVIGNLSGTITLNNENVTLNASSITGGNISATAYGAIFTGANTLNRVTLDATGQTITVGNSGSLTVSADSSIIAGNAGTSGTGSLFIVDASGVDWTEFTGFRKIIDDQYDDGSLNVGPEGNVSLASGAPKKVHLQQITGSDDVYIGNEDQSILYVNSSYSADGENDNHLYGYNAFSSLDQITDPKKAGSTAVFTETKTIVFVSGQSLGTGNARYYYAPTATSANPVTVTLSATGGSEIVQIGYKRFYLTSAVILNDDPDHTGYYTIDTTTLPTFVIDNSLNLKFISSGPFRIGEAYDHEDKISQDRTPGAANLTIDGSVVGSGSEIHLAAYSTATISKTGRYSNTNKASTSGLILRSNSVLTVNGDDTVPLEEKKNQVEMSNITLWGGGTVNINDTKAQISRFRLVDTARTETTGPLFWPSDRVISVTNSYIETVTDYSGFGWDDNGTYREVESGFFHDMTDGTGVAMTLEDSTLVVHNDFNPNAKTTVTINSSTLNANTITNSGTITMNNDSILIANSITNNATFQVSNSKVVGNAAALEVVRGTPDSTGTIYTNEGTLEISGSLFDYEYVINKESREIEILNSTFVVSDTLINKGAITVTAGTTEQQNTTTLEVNSVSETSTAPIIVEDKVTLKNSTVGGVNGTVKVQENATLTLDGTNSFTTLDLSGASVRVTMDSQDRLSFTGFGSSYANKFTIDMSNYSYSRDGVGYLLLDSANNDWTEEMYQELLTNEWNPASASYKFVVKNGDLYAMDHFITATVAALGNDAVAKANPNNSNYDFGTIDGATSVIPDKIVVEGGVFTSTASSLKGIESIIEAGEFRSVMGGKSVSNSSGSDTITTGDISLTVQSGTFQKLVVAGDCSNAGTTIRCKDYDDDGGAGITYDKCDIEFNISGGEFSNPVVGGMAYMGTDDDTGMAALYGDVNLNITGGSFTSYLYGGSIARSKLVSGRTNINGNVTITVDAGSTPRTTTEKIVLNKVACGSYNTGTIMGSTKLVMTGLGENIVFLSSGEIWGGCGDDYYKANVERTFVTKVSGTRTLSFTGFNGELNSNCEKIRGFSHIEFVDRTWDAKTGTWTVYEYGDANSNEYGCKVELDTAGTGNYNLSDMKFWTFGENSSLSGKFKNDFKGDTLRLNGFADSGSQTLISTATDNASIVFNSFGGVDGAGTDSSITFAEIQMGTWDATNKLWTYETVDAVFHEATNAWTWGDAYTGAYTLGLQTDDLGTTSLILSRS